MNDKHYGNIKLVMNVYGNGTYENKSTKYGKLWWMNKIKNDEQNMMDK